MKELLGSPVFLFPITLLMSTGMGYVLYQWAVTGTLPVRGRREWIIYSQSPFGYSLSAFFVVTGTLLFGFAAICAFRDEIRSVFGLGGVFPIKPVWQALLGRRRSKGSEMAAPTSPTERPRLRLFVKRKFNRDEPPARTG